MGCIRGIDARGGKYKLVLLGIHCWVFGGCGGI